MFYSYLFRKNGIKFLNLCYWNKLFSLKKFNLLGFPYSIVTIVWTTYFHFSFKKTISFIFCQEVVSKKLILANIYLNSLFYISPTFTCISKLVNLKLLPPFQFNCDTFYFKKFQFSCDTFILGNNFSPITWYPSIFFLYLSPLQKIVYESVIFKMA